jgi:hypothetical protein
MITKSAKVAVVSAFLAGGVLVGVFTLATGAAQGTTNTTTTTNPTPPPFPVQHAWAQQVGTSAPLAIPAGDRLTITGAYSVPGGFYSCSISAAVNGSHVMYPVSAQPADGTSQNQQGFAYPPTTTTFLPIYADSGAVACPTPFDGTPASVTLVGYLSPGV